MQRARRTAKTQQHVGRGVREGQGTLGILRKERWGPMERRWDAADRHKIWPGGHRGKVLQTEKRMWAKEKMLLGRTHPPIWLGDHIKGSRKR